MRRILMMGPPGVGKGTQSAVLSVNLHVPTISTGDIFRHLAASRSPLAEEVQQVMAAGRYIDDELTNRVLTERLLREDCADGFVLDGYPRTLPQLDYLHRWLGDRSQRIDAVVLLEADEETMVRRMAARAALEGRRDDTLEAFRVRLRTYAEQTLPLVAVYDELGLLRRVEATGPVDEVARRVFDAVRAAAADGSPSGG